MRSFQKFETTIVRWIAVVAIVLLNPTPSFAQAGAPWGSSPPPPQAPPSFREQAVQSAVAPCLQPPPLPGLSDYDGPMKKTVGIFARALERKSVHPPNYRPGATLCSLTIMGKLRLFVDDSTDPITILSAGFDAAMDQSSNRDPAYGQGAQGFAKRLGASLTDRTSSMFFKDFAYPVIFSEDPRYYRLGHGGAGKRLLHAAGHLVMAHRPDGSPMPNYSEWFGTASSVALSNIYHPGEDRGAGAMARNTAYRFTWNVGFDVLREFWPDIAHKWRLPFRGIRENARPAPPSGKQSG